MEVDQLSNTLAGLRAAAPTARITAAMTLTNTHLLLSDPALVAGVGVIFGEETDTFSPQFWQKFELAPSGFPQPEQKLDLPFGPASTM